MVNFDEDFCGCIFRFWDDSCRSIFVVKNSRSRLSPKTVSMVHMWIYKNDKGKLFSKKLQRFCDQIRVYRYNKNIQNIRRMPISKIAQNYSNSSLVNSVAIFNALQTSHLVVDLLFPQCF